MKKPTKTKIDATEAHEATLARIQGEIAGLRLDVSALQVATMEKAAAVEPLTDAEQLATQDMLIGLWMQEQRDGGVTNIDLSIVDHIRTGIALALR